MNLKDVVPEYGTSIELHYFKGKDDVMGCDGPVIRFDSRDQLIDALEEARKVGRMDPWHVGPEPDYYLVIPGGELFTNLNLDEHSYKSLEARKEEKK